MESGGDEEEAGAEEAMLWSIQEALERQTLQIGASACGATAVVDVLKALGVDVAPEEADRCVQTRLRRNESPLPDYLLSRSEAGATHLQLIAGAEEASKGKVIGRFFHFHPRRRVKLVPWLARWIRKGSVPVATMNMQLVVPEGEEVPDAWHHQLIFGVAPTAVFMTNPLDLGTRYCYTLHMMDNHGDSVSVTKRCMTLEDCLFTGCAHVTDDGSQVCSSCCEGNICNVLVPRNESSAVFSSTSPLVSSSTGLHPATLSSICTISILAARHL